MKKNKFIGTWHKLNVKYNSKKEIIKTNYTPRMGLFYNQIRCGMMLHVVEKLCEKDKNCYLYFLVYTEHTKMLMQK